MKNYVPWWLKITLKLVLSRLPIDYRFWSKHGLFRHGAMIDPDYAYQVFQHHLEKSELHKKNSAFTCLELGCGDSVSSALIAKSFGAARCYLIDSACFASKNVADYEPIARLLEKNGQAIPFQPSNSFDQMLEICDGIYMTDGLDSLKLIPDHSIDFIFSHAVLEHIRLHEFAPTLKELKRILKPQGIMSHRVDLRDHLNDALNNLRFSERVWESTWMSQSGFYTNRIRFTEMINLLKSIGLKPSVVNTDRWSSLPTQKSAMHKQFRDLPESELCIQGFDVLLTHAD